jgi:hypothetical protein
MNKSHNSDDYKQKKVIVNIFQIYLQRVEGSENVELWNAYITSNFGFYSTLIINMNLISTIMYQK